MGQQQLLLVILVTILVGIATVVAINVFGDAAIQANRDAVRQDLLTASAQAQAIWARPNALGGVQGEFDDDDAVADAQFVRLLGIPGSVSGLVITNENAQYTVARTSADLMTISAVPLSYGHNLTMTIERLSTAAPDGGFWRVSYIDAGAGTEPIYLSGAPS